MKFSGRAGAKKEKGKHLEVIPLFIFHTGGSFGGVHHSFEGFGVVHGQIGQGFPVQIDVVGCQFVHQAAVSGAVGTGCSVDTGNPKATVSALFELSTNIGKSHGAVHGVFGYGPDVFTTAEKTFGLFENFFASGTRRSVVD